MLVPDEYPSIIPHLSVVAAQLTHVFQYLCSDFRNLPRNISNLSYSALLFNYLPGTFARKKPPSRQYAKFSDFTHSRVSSLRFLRLCVSLLPLHPSEDRLFPDILFIPQHHLDHPGQHIIGKVVGLKSQFHEAGVGRIVVMVLSLNPQINSG